MTPKFIIYLLLGMFFLGCANHSNEEQKTIIAKVNNKHLTADELAAEMSQYQFSPDDSADFAKNYVNNWIKTQLLMIEIEKKLTAEELNVEKELEDYRQKLLIHRFKSKETQYITDSVITQNEAQEYYQHNKKSFVLQNPIVKIEYLILPSEVEIPQNILQLLLKGIKNKETEDFIFSYARKYDNFNNDWMYFEPLLRNTNLNINDMAKFLRSENKLEFTDNSETHLIIIREHKLSGEQAPFNFVENRIRNLLINNKKIDFLREIKDSLYNNALKYNNFEAFNQ